MNSLTIEGNPVLFKYKSLTIEGNPLLNKEIPYHRRKSGNPLLGTKPLSLEGIPYYRRISLTIYIQITYYMRKSLII